MSPTNEFRYSNITEALDDIDRNDRLRMMWQLTEFAMNAALAAVAVAKFRADLKSKPAVTSAPAVQRPAPARGSCWRCTPAVRLE
jgi:hypothetical protein